MTRRGMSPAGGIESRSGISCGRNRSAGHGPHLAKRPFHLGDGRAFDFDPCVPPGFDFPIGVSHPHAAHAQAGYIGNPSVDADHFPVVAGHPAQRAFEARRVETPDLDPFRLKFFPEPARSLPQPSHPVVQDADFHPLFCFAGEDLGKLPADVIPVDDVAFKVDEFFRPLEGFDPGRVVFRGVLEKADPVARHKGRSGRAGKDLFRKGPRRQRNNLDGLLYLIRSHNR